MKKEHTVEREGKTVQLCACGCGQPAPIATKTDRRFGWIKGEPMRFVLGHANRRNLPDYLEVDRGYDTPCWEWQRGIGKDGYGMTGTGANAHRRLYERHKGPVPTGMELDHLCRNRACVNPAHLEPVTHSVNSKRSPIIGRWPRRQGVAA